MLTIGAIIIAAAFVGFVLVAWFMAYKPDTLKWPLPDDAEKAQMQHTTPAEDPAQDKITNALNPKNKVEPKPMPRLSDKQP